MTEPQLDDLDQRLFDFLDKESTFGKIKLNGDVADDVKVIQVSMVAKL